MKRLERHFVIRYWWYRADGAEICPGHVEDLDEHAADHIRVMTQRGYTSGKLRHELESYHRSGITSTDYQGGWIQDRMPE